MFAVCPSASRTGSRLFRGFSCCFGFLSLLLWLNEGVEIDDAVGGGLDFAVFEVSVSGDDDVFAQLSKPTVKWDESLIG